MHEMIIETDSALGPVWQCQQCPRRLISQGRAGFLVINHGERVSHVSAQTG